MLSKSAFMSLFLMISAIAWGVSYYFFNRVRKAYKNLRQQVGQVQQLAEKMQHQLEQMRQQMQQQGEQMQEQMGKIQQHLLLEHMADVAARAKEMSLINSETFDKSIQTLHMLEMDNLQGEKSNDSESN